MSKIVRPPELLYAFDEKIPLSTTILLACQYLVSVMGASLIFPIILIQSMNITPLMAASIISICIFVMGLITVLQALHWGPIGSGTFLPMSASPNFLAQSILAIKSGGLPLLFGMTIIAGISQCLFTFIIEKIRKYFPSEIAAMVLTLIGIELATLGVNQYFKLPNLLNDATSFNNPLFFYFINFIPLVLMIIFERWGRGFLKIYGLVISVIIGYVLIYLCGFMDAVALKNITTASWLFFPEIAPQGYKFDVGLLIPFLIGALVNTIKICGAVTALQEMQDVNWHHPQMQQIARANATDSLGSFIGGFLGGMGFNASSSSIALSLSTGVTSKYIAYPFALIMIFLAFCPKISLLFVYMPQALIAAVLFALGATLFINGLKMLLRYMRNFKQKLNIGISFVFGLSYSVYPDIYTGLPHSIQMLAGSSLALATLCAMLLNFIFMLRIKK